MALSDREDLAQDHIATLPSELRKEYFYRSFPMRSLFFFARTCRLAEKESRVFRLLHYAVNSMPVSFTQIDKTQLAALEMLKLYPDLLFVKDFVQCYLGLIYGSAFQIFLGMGDVRALEVIRKEILPRVENGLTQAIEHYQQQFPYHAQGILYDDRNIAQIATVKADLKEISTAIAADECIDHKATNNNTIDALNLFRKHLEPTHQEVIKTGLHSPPEIMKLIHEEYEANFGVWSSAALIVYSCDVFGKAETVASKVDGQRYSNGLYFLSMNIPLNRTLSYFLPSGEPKEGLGDQLFIDWYFGHQVTHIGAQAAGIPVLASMKEQYLANHSELLILMERWKQLDAEANQVKVPTFNS